MQIGMIGLGRMGANMVRRLLRGGHQCVVFDVNPKAVAELAGEGATGASSLDDFTTKLTKPRVTWMMMAATPTTSMTSAAPRRSRPRACIMLTRVPAAAFGDSNAASAR